MMAMSEPTVSGAEPPAARLSRVRHEALLKLMSPAHPSLQADVEDIE